MKRFIRFIALFFGIGWLTSLTGCKTVTASTPLAPGYVTAGEQTVGEVIASADAIVLKYEADVQSGTYKPTPAVTSAVSAIQQALAVADPLAVTWHQALLANASSAEPAALATAVSTITSNITHLPESAQ